MKKAIGIVTYIFVGVVIAGISTISFSRSQDATKGSVKKMGVVKNIKTSDELDSHIKNNDVIVVKFYTPWCGYCKMIAPSYQKMAKVSSAEFAEIDCSTPEGQKVSQKYKIAGFPTFTIHKHGNHVDTVVGANQADLEKKVTKALKK